MIKRAFFLFALCCLSYSSGIKTVTSAELITADKSIYYENEFEEIKENYRGDQKIDSLFYLWIGMFGYYKINGIQFDILMNDSLNRFINEQRLNQIDYLKKKDCVLLDDASKKHNLKALKVFNYYLKKRDEDVISDSIIQFLTKNDKKWSYYHKYKSRGKLFSPRKWVYNPLTELILTNKGYVIHNLSSNLLGIDVFATNTDLEYYLTGICAIYGKDENDNYNIILHRYDHKQMVLKLLRKYECEIKAITSTIENNTLEIKIFFLKSKAFDQKIIKKLDELKVVNLI